MDDLIKKHDLILKLLEMDLDLEYHELHHLSEMLEIIKARIVALARIEAAS